MITLDITLPRGALLPKRLPSSFKMEHPVIWFSPEPSDFNDRIWSSKTDETVARPAKPNKSAADLGSAFGRAMLFSEAQSNCGFAIEKLEQQSSTFSGAILFSSEGNAATLLSLHQNGAEGYFFISEDDGHIRAAYQGHDASIICPSPPEGQLNALLFCISGGRITLALNSNEPRSDTLPLSFKNEPLDIFLLCRSDRSGITKTLGEAGLADVFLWPDADIFSSTYDHDRNWLLSQQNTP